MNENRSKAIRIDPTYNSLTSISNTEKLHVTHILLRKRNLVSKANVYYTQNANCYTD